MKKRVLIALLASIAGTLALLVATGSAGIGKITGPSKAKTLPSSSCGPVIYKGAGKPANLIASDLPMQGANRPQTTQMTKAIQFILQGRGWKAGNRTIGYQVCDDSTAQAGAWDAAECRRNAQAYGNDRSVIGVIGTFN